MKKGKESLISIIVPIYNVQQYLDRCIKSIVSQTYHNLEIILVDDGSSDHCPQMCERWAEEDKRIRVIHQKNQGLSAARNVALDICQGEYILFVDSDDWISSRLCEEILGKLVDTDADIVIFDFLKCFRESGKVLTVSNRSENERAINGKEAIFMLIEDKLSFGVWSRMYKKSIFDAIRFPEGKCYEDIPVSYQIMQMAKKIYLWERAFYYHEKRRDSITGSQTQKSFVDRLEIEIWGIKYIWKYWPEFVEVYKRRIGDIAYTICCVAGKGPGGEMAATLLRNHELCSASRKARFFLSHEKIFWVFLNAKRQVKDSKVGKAIWKIKWRLIFELKGEKRSDDNARTKIS